MGVPPKDASQPGAFWLAEGRTVRSRRPWWVFALLGALALLALGVGVRAATHPAPPYGGYSWADLRALPESGLVYPGATLLAEYGHEAAGGGTRPEVAETGYGAAVPADPAAIEAWYDAALRVRRWAPEGPFGGTTAEVRTVGWHRGTLRFRFSVRKPGDPRNVPTPAALAGQTLIDVFLIPDTPPR